ncbi:Uncharacterised protein [Chlamydia trachomatis]|nr:Uncharacterised protein [Chlamydia trachomatis]
MFRGFTTDQRGSGCFASASNAGDDRCDTFGDNVSARDVVGHQHGACADHDDIVNDHANQVLADGVVNVHGLRDSNLRTDAVRGGGEQRLLHAY